MNATVFLFLCILSICTSSSNVLDINDYSFYLNTYHYDLETTQQDITLADHIHLSIDLEHLIIDITTDHDHASLEITNDNDWNQISLISSVDNYTKIHYEAYIAI
eukprot:405702_1